VAQRAAAAVLIGETASEMQTLFARAGLARIERASDLESAVRRAYAIGRSKERPATVLLSPAATSFDMFVDYAARGDAFKAAVATLQQEELAKQP